MGDLKFNTIPERQQYAILFLTATLFRYCIGLSQFSGQKNSSPPPGQAPWGDFECHRTWMAVTNQLPLEQWYTNSTISNISYWPMDYPPLCAEMHYIMSTSIQWLEPKALNVSGFAEPRYIFLMRTWVIVWEYLIFVPAAIYFLKVTTQKVTPWGLFLITCIPSTLIVDNVHFQFNQVMHGLVLWAIAFILDGHIVLATIAMVLSINFKQMSLYFSLPFGVFALATLIKKHKTSTLKICAEIALLITAFVATNLAVWAPFLIQGGTQTFNDIVFRIFPIRRGIFESKVATFWCMLNHCGLKYFKVNQWERPLQLKMTTIATLLACLPSLTLLFYKSSRKNFMLA